MSETIRGMHRTVRMDAGPSDDDPAADLPFTLPVELTVRDQATIQELCAHEEGPQREAFAINALRIGVLALKQARGQVDADLVRRESERLMEALESRLDQHTHTVHDRLTTSLKEYFDPEDGRFQERVERLVKQDGELESLLRRQIGNEDSQLSKTLAAHFGQESPLMKHLSPDQTDGLLVTLRTTLDEQLMAEREHVLGQFSLDNKEGALARFIGELTERQGELSEELHSKINEVVREFSLDDDESALSRLVRNVDRAQKTITNEFSLDEEGSSLARLKRELLELLKEDRDENRTFQEEVKTTLKAIEVRKQEAARSTRHGIEFEDEVCRFVVEASKKTGDVATETGTLAGLIKGKGSKVGDCVVELSAESAAPGAKVVIEAKDDQSYKLKGALNELETARKNRDAEVGIFVFSRNSSPEGLEELARFGNDIVLAWDAEDPGSDVFLRAGLTLARALCVRSRKQKDRHTADFTNIDKAILEVEKQSQGLEEMTTWTQTIQSNSEKILDKIRRARKALDRQVGRLQDETDALKQSLAAEGSAE